MDNQEGLPAAKRLPLFLTIELPTDGEQQLQSPPKMPWDSSSGERLSDSVESTVEEIVDMTLPTPLPKKKKLITESYKPTFCFLLFCSTL